MESKINVTVRVKPLLKKDAQPTAQLWQKVSDNTLMNSRTKELHSFDQVFDQEVTTLQVFDQSVKGLVHNALQGINQTVFAYGQTSSGKTFTMRGPSANQLKHVSEEQAIGLIPLSVMEIFNFIQQDSERRYKITVSYLEVSTTIQFLTALSLVI